MKTSSLSINDVFSRELKYPFNGFVIYSGVSWTSMLTIGDSYMHAVNKIMEPLYKAKKEGGEADIDIVAFPCLFLLRHAAESYLKYYLFFLVEYNEEFSFFNYRKNDEWKRYCFNEHRLFSIADYIYRIVKPNTVLRNTDFKRFLKFFNEFDHVDKKSTAFRYGSFGISEQVDLHNTQTYVYIFKLVELVEELRSNIMFFTDGDVKSFQRLGFYSDDFIKDMQESINILELFVNILNENKYNFTDDNVAESAQALMNRFDHKGYIRWKNEITSLFSKKAKDGQFVLACNAMYFGRDFSYPSVESPKIAIDTLFSKRPSLPDYLEKSKENLKIIKQYYSIWKEQKLFSV